MAYSEEYKRDIKIVEHFIGDKIELEMTNTSNKEHILKVNYDNFSNLGETYYKTLPKIKIPKGKNKIFVTSQIVSNTNKSPDIIVNIKSDGSVSIENDTDSYMEYKFIYPKNNNIKDSKAGYLTIGNIPHDKVEVTSQSDTKNLNMHSQIHSIAENI